MAKPPPALDAGTLRVLAHELERNAMRQRKCGAMVGVGASNALAWNYAASTLDSFARRFRARATRIEKGKRHA